MSKFAKRTALAALLLTGVTYGAAYAASDNTGATSPGGTAQKAPSNATKQKSGDGDTGYGDRANVTKQRTGDGDTGFGDRPKKQ